MAKKQAKKEAKPFKINGSFHDVLMASTKGSAKSSAKADLESRKPPKEAKKAPAKSKKKPQ